MSRAWAGGSTWSWRKTRSYVLGRDGQRCQIKLDGCATVATQVHHKLGRGVSENPADLEAACQSCNNKVGNPRGNDPTPRPTRTTW